MPQLTLVDTHTHLYLPEFETDRQILIREALEKGISRFLLPNIDGSSIEAMHRLSDEFPENCLPMMGLHPCSVKENWKTEMERVEQLLAQRRYFGVGETGMDLYWDKSFVKEQEEVLRMHIRLGNEHRLPMSIHSRESFEEIYRLLLVTKKEQPCGVFHCFTGNADQAKRAIDLGFFLGIGGVVTFKNSGLDKALAEISLEHIVLETDAPYLAPVPFRGKRNVPAYVVKVAEKIAEIKKTSVEEVARITTENARRIFSLT